MVGLVLPELQNPIFPAYGEVLGGALAQNGYTPVLCTQTVGGISEADYVELLERRIAGAAVDPGQSVGGISCGMMVWKYSAEPGL